MSSLRFTPEEAEAVIRDTKPKIVAKELELQNLRRARRKAVLTLVRAGRSIRGIARQAGITDSAVHKMIERGE